jgi:hypothetical protein
MYLILECVTLVGLIFTFGILLFGFCVAILLISWGFQKAVRQVEKSAAERAIHRPTMGSVPSSGPATPYRFQTFLGRRFASEAPSAMENGQGVRSGPTPHILQ